MAKQKPKKNTKKTQSSPQARIKAVAKSAAKKGSAKKAASKTSALKKTPLKKAPAKSGVEKKKVATKVTAKSAQKSVQKSAHKTGPVSAKVTAKAAAKAAVKAAAKATDQWAKIVQSTRNDLKKTAPIAGASSKDHRGTPAFSSAGDLVCREVSCETVAIAHGYCRAHYIKNWKKIQAKSLILKEKKLDQFIDELAAKVPSKYLEAIRSDLMSDHEFAKVVTDLELDDSVNEEQLASAEDEDDQDQVMTSIRRGGFGDEGETY
jgi:hypothetical protein